MCIFMLVHTYTHFCADVNPSLTFDDYRDGLYLELYNHLLAISHDCIFKVAEVRGLYKDIVFFIQHAGCSVHKAVTNNEKCLEILRN